MVWRGEREGERTIFKEPNHTGSRPSDIIGLCRQHTKPAPQHTRKGREDMVYSRGKPRESVCDERVIEEGNSGNEEIDSDE